MGYNVLDIVTMEFYTNRLRFQKNTLPRFTTPSISYVEYETRKARRYRSAILGGFLFCLIGGTLMVFATMGGSIPVLVLSCAFFGAGFLSIISAFLTKKNLHC